MSEENKVTEKELDELAQEGMENSSESVSAETEVESESQEKSCEEKLEEALLLIDKLNDQILRLRAEFDNYRKRTLKEKTELILNGGEKVITSILPVLDDWERALDSVEQSSDFETLKEGMVLIKTKLDKALAAQGLKKMNPQGEAFDTDFHEAIALVPVPDEEQKNKVIDCVQAGYLLNEKVVRHAKVVVGQ